MIDTASYNSDHFLAKSRTARRCRVLTEALCSAKG